MPRPTIAISMGDPLGIGPEIIVRALATPKLRQRARFVIRGLEAPLRRAALQLGVEPFWRQIRHDASTASTGVGQGALLLHYAEHEAAGEPRERPGPTKLGGEASFRFVEDAIADAKRSAGDPLRADAIVTAPISKEAWALAGRGKYPGHTELLATRFQARRHLMMFVSPRLRIALATGHIPLLELRDRLTIGKVFDAIDLGIEGALALGVERPRVAVCGMNPHAGEGGLLGDEENRLIEPAIRLAVDAGHDVKGPFPADTIFRRAIDGAFDLVVAMYHDQGLIPVKTLEWERAVNCTIGLPVLRTSPDHGTAYDIAGRGKADPSSLLASIDLAVRAGAIEARQRARKHAASDASNR
jgi:4-phospho-D-threonate 3-dehydrogenase / 4-phospho-D-erythronate 3-dehydrogenase